MYTRSAMDGLFVQLSGLWSLVLSHYCSLKQWKLLSVKISVLPLLYSTNNCIVVTVVVVDSSVVCCLLLLLFFLLLLYGCECIYLNCCCCYYWCWISLFYCCFFVAVTSIYVTFFSLLLNFFLDSPHFCSLPTTSSLLLILDNTEAHSEHTEQRNF